MRFQDLSDIDIIIIFVVMLTFAIPCCIYFCCPCRNYRTYNRDNIYNNEIDNNILNNPDELPA